MLDRMFLLNGADTDPNFENVTLLLPGNGSNGAQNNTFLDGSSNNFTITRNGNTTQGSYSPFTSKPYSPAVNGGSGYLDGTGDYLSAPAGSAWAFGTGDFTVECWVYFAPGSSSGRITNRLPTSGAAGTWGFNFSPTTFAFTEVVAGEPGVTATGLPVMTSAWTHLVACRSGTTLRLFANGVQVGSGTNSTNFSNTSYALELGRTGSGAGQTNITGYMSNVRVVKGTALYTAAFTPPTAPVTAVTNTQLLCNFTNAGIVDASTKNDLETVGNAQVSTAQSKFGGSSMAFDGTGDWLIAPHTVDQQLGTGNLTVEGWLYLSATGAARGIVGKGTATTGWLLSINATNNVVFTYGSSTITSATALAGSTWYYLAVVREGTGTNQTKIYINGTNSGTGTVSTDFNQTNVLYVGANRTGGDALNGYIDDLRITKGLARYTTNFTPPTSPFPVQ